MLVWRVKAIVRERHGIELGWEQGESGLLSEKEERWLLAF